LNADEVAGHLLLTVVPGADSVPPFWPQQPVFALAPVGRNAALPTVNDEL